MVFSVENYWSHGGLLVYRDWWWPPFAPRAECFQLARLYQITPRVWRVGELNGLVEGGWDEEGNGKREHESVRAGGGRRVEGGTPSSYYGGFRLPLSVWSESLSGVVLRAGSRRS